MRDKLHEVFSQKTLDQNLTQILIEHNFKILEGRIPVPLVTKNDCHSEEAGAAAAAAAVAISQLRQRRQRQRMAAPMPLQLRHMRHLVDTTWPL